MAKTSEARSMTGKRVLVTGASAGIGRYAAGALAKLDAEVILLGRSEERTRQAAEEIGRATGKAAPEIALVDLSLQSSIRAFASRFLDEGRPLHVLVNNAGVALERRVETAEGIEATWATNVLAYHLMVKLLAPTLAPGARVVNVASQYAGELELDDVEFRRRRYDNNTAYRQSKQADRMLAWAQARRLAASGATLNVMHPGPVRTDLLKSLMGSGNFGRTTEQGADTIVWLAGSADVEGRSGGFYMDRSERPCEFRGEAGEERLYALCESMVSR